MRKLNLYSTNHLWSSISANYFAPYSYHSGVKRFCSSTRDIDRIRADLKSAYKDELTLNWRYTDPNESPAKRDDYYLDGKMIEKDEIRDQLNNAQPVFKTQNLDEIGVTASIEELLPLDTDQEFQPLRQLVTAASGTGKSELCNHILYQWAKGDHLQQFDWVFLIPLNNLTPTLQTKEEAPSKLLKDIAIHVNTIENFEVAEKEIKQNPQKVLYLLDAFDELPKLPIKDSKNTLVDKLLDQKNVVLTSRFYSIPRFKSNRRLELLGFTKPSILKYIGNYFSSKESSSKLITQLENNPNMLELARTPFILELLCFSWDPLVNELPTTRTELYQRVTMSMLRRHLEKQGSEATADLRDSEVGQEEELGNKLAVLKELAFAGLIEQETKLNANMIDHIKGNDLIDSFKPGFLHSFDMGRHEAKKTYFFPHKSIQEYLAAEKWAEMFLSTDSIDRTTAFNLLKEQKYNPYYSEFWRFAAGKLAGNNTALDLFFQTILSEPRDLAVHYEFMLVLNCLEESRLESSSATDTEIKIMTDLSTWLDNLDLKSKPGLNLSNIFVNFLNRSLFVKKNDIIFDSFHQETEGGEIQLKNYKEHVQNLLTQLDHWSLNKKTDAALKLAELNVRSSKVINVLTDVYNMPRLKYDIYSGYCYKRYFPKVTAGPLVFCLFGVLVPPTASISETMLAFTFITVPFNLLLSPAFSFLSPVDKRRYNQRRAKIIASLYNLDGENYNTQNIIKTHLLSENSETIKETLTELIAYRPLNKTNRLPLTGIANEILETETNHTLKRLVKDFFSIEYPNVRHRIGENKKLIESVFVELNRRIIQDKEEIYEDSEGFPDHEPFMVNQFKIQSIKSELFTFDLEFLFEAILKHLKNKKTLLTHDPNKTMWHFSLFSHDYEIICILLKKAQFLATPIVINENVCTAFDRNSRITFKLDSERTEKLINFIMKSAHTYLKPIFKSFDLPEFSELLINYPKNADILIKALIIQFTPQLQSLLDDIESDFRMINNAISSLETDGVTDRYLKDFLDLQNLIKNDLDYVNQRQSESSYNFYMLQNINRKLQEVYSTIISLNDRDTAITITDNIRDQIAIPFNRIQEIYTDDPLKFNELCEDDGVSTTIHTSADALEKDTKARDSFEATLRNIGKHYQDPAYRTKKCFISYAWPVKSPGVNDLDIPKEEESWVQPFLEQLRHDLRLMTRDEKHQNSIIIATLDFKDNEMGKNIHTFMKDAYESDFVLLICTESLLIKHKKGVSLVCEELNQIKRKREEDQRWNVKEGVLPLLLSGNFKKSVPIAFESYTTVRDWRDKKYASCVKKLVGHFFNAGEDNIPYQNLWKDFESKHSEHIEQKKPICSTEAPSKKHPGSRLFSTYRQPNKEINFPSDYSHNTLRLT